LLPKDQRLAKGSDIRSTTRGNRINTPLLTIHTRENQTGEKRFVVICRKSIGSAVIRNRTRRTLIAAYSINRHNIAKNMDIVVLPRKALRDLKSAEKALVIGLRIDNN
jgi:ribonuclease P protein component